MRCRTDGYLVDIVDVEHNPEVIVAYYRDKTLNDLPEFSGLNPRTSTSRLSSVRRWRAAFSKLIR